MSLERAKADAKFVRGDHRVSIAYHQRLHRHLAPHFILEILPKGSQPIKLFQGYDAKRYRRGIQAIQVAEGRRCSFDSD